MSNGDCVILSNMAPSFTVNIFLVAVEYKEISEIMKLLKLKQESLYRYLIVTTSHHLTILIHLKPFSYAKTNFISHLHRFRARVLTCLKHEQGGEQLRGYFGKGKWVHRELKQSNIFLDLIDIHSHVIRSFQAF